MTDPDVSEYTPPVFDTYEQQLIEESWKVRVIPGRPATPKARLEAAHPSGAQLVIVARPTKRPARRTTWKRRAARHFVCPPPAGGIRSPWYRAANVTQLLEFAHTRSGTPFQSANSVDPPVPTGVQPPRCEHRKVAYSSKEDADLILLDLKILGAFKTAKRREARVYQCPDDPRVWHLTSKPTRAGHGAAVAGVQGWKP